MLYLVPTPIGNLGDMTTRAIDTLRSVDLILAEDTRTTGKLRKHFDIETPMRSYHAFNEHKVVSAIVSQLSNGANYALVTDAGTPCISDPGFLLVRACHEAGVSLTCLPGASALTCAVAVSGIPSDRFYFEGFLPVKKGRQTRLKYISQLDCTVVLYESPHRLIKTTAAILEYFGPKRTISVVKEISKIHETIYHGLVQDVLQKLTGLPSIKGEYVIVIGC